MTDYHFFVTCAWGWQTSPDPLSCLQTLKQRFGDMAGEDGLYVIFILVPLPPSATYEIKDFLPVVENLEKIYEGEI